MTRIRKNWIVAILAVILTFSIALLGVCDLKSARAEETIDKCYDYKFYQDTWISGEVYAGKTVVFDDIFSINFPSLSNWEIGVDSNSPTNLTFYLTHGTDVYEVASLEGNIAGEGVWFNFPEVLEFNEDVIESISGFTSMVAIDFRNEILEARDQFCVLTTEYQVTDLKVGDVVDGKMLACPYGLDMSMLPGPDNPMTICLSNGSVYYSVGDLWYTQPDMSDAFSDDYYIYKGNWCTSNLVGLYIPESDEDVTVTSISYGSAGTSFPYGMKIVSEISEEPIEPPVEDPIEPPVEEPTEPPVQEPSDDAAGQTPDVPKDDNVKDDASKDDNKNDVVDEEKVTFKDWVKDNGGLLIALGAFLAIMIITAIVLKKKRR